MKHWSPIEMRGEQTAVLSRERESAGFLRIMFAGADLIYGRSPSLRKCRVLELLARYPYWVWEQGGYRWVTRLMTVRTPDHAQIAEAMRLIETGRSAQDNEQWHLLILEEILTQRCHRFSRIFDGVIPRIMAFMYHLLCAFLFRIRPEWSFRLNMHFERHAEFEYMSLAQHHPEWDTEEVHSRYFDRYPPQRFLNDLLRRIALDEREHADESAELIRHLQGKKERVSLGESLS